MVIARSRRGIRFSDKNPEVHAIFFLTGSMDQRHFHLVVISNLARIVNDPSFDEAWINAPTTEDLRKLYSGHQKETGKTGQRLMANVRDLIQKIETLRNMQKVIHAMNMIATIRLRKLFPLQEPLGNFQTVLDGIFRDIRGSSGRTHSSRNERISEDRESSYGTSLRPTKACAVHITRMSKKP